MKLDYVEVWYSERWVGWYWTAWLTGDRAHTEWHSEGEYTRRADAERGAERYVAREWPDFELGPWADA